MSSSAAPTLADGRYTIVRQLGEGGMATVFLGWDGKLKVWRAVKALLPQYASKSKLRRRFENEAHAMAQLEHPHIIRVYDVGLEGSAPFMVMEYAQGGCVVDWLEQHGPMPPRMAAEVIIQASKGLHAAHEVGIVHRDVKPHNILITRKGVCKMTDFGIAQVISNDSLTKTGSVMGTWGYMAPEQRTNAKSVDERADVFGLGATLYALLSGETPTELYMAERDDDTFEGIAAPLVEVILKACAYKAENRYVDVKRFARAVRDAARSCPTIPDGTPSLVLPSPPLPRSLAEVRVLPSQASELRTALGLDLDDEPTASGPLPYYNSEEEEDLPDYIDRDAYRPPPRPKKQVIAPAPTPRTAPATSRPWYMPSSWTSDRTTRTEASVPPRFTDGSLDTTGVSADAAETPRLSAADLALRAAVLPVLAGLAMVLLLGWSMITVNGAQDEAILAFRPLHQLLSEEAQGPIIDGLVLGGADKAELEEALRAYHDARDNRVEAARAYIRLVEQRAQELQNQQPVRDILPGVEQLIEAGSTFDRAERAWAEQSRTFPGNLAVQLGLSQAP